MIFIIFATIRCHLTGELQNFLNRPLVFPMISKIAEKIIPAIEAITVPASKKTTAIKAGISIKKTKRTQQPPIFFLLSIVDKSVKGHALKILFILANI